VGKAKRLRIAFLHPDLGIGGAERLIVDAAAAMIKKVRNACGPVSQCATPCFMLDRTAATRLSVRHADVSVCGWCLLASAPCMCGPLCVA